MRDCFKKSMNGPHILKKGASQVCMRYFLIFYGYIFTKRLFLLTEMWNQDYALGAGFPEGRPRPRLEELFFGGRI